MSCSSRLRHDNPNQRVDEQTRVTRACGSRNRFYCSPCLRFRRSPGDFARFPRSLPGEPKFRPMVTFCLFGVGSILLRILVPLTKVIITPPLVLRVAASALLLPPPLSGVVLVASPGRIVSSVYAPVTLFTAAAAAAALSPGATYEQQSKLEVSQSVSRPVGLANRQAGGPECAWQGTFCTAVPVPAAVTVVETASGIAAAVARASILAFALALASVLLLSLLLLLAPLSHSPVVRCLTCARGQ